MKKKEITHNPPEKMDLRSKDLGADNRAGLKALFPSVFTETRNEKGELVESIDFEKLKAELGTFSDLFEARRERYGMDWPGKKDCMKLIQEPSIATLKPCREESVKFEDTENLFIEGDNLEVLKLLQKSYYGRVKMIYIDPPYNTGKEFIYPDNYSETLDTYLAYAGLVDDKGRRFSTNTPNEGRFHTRWLNMMYPRLYLARNLLREDGVIFISIDDNEIIGLRKLCDEIFGEENLVGTIVWKGATDNNPTRIAVEHEYIICYCKSKESLMGVWKSKSVDAKALMLSEYNALKKQFSGNVDKIREEFRKFIRNNAEILNPLTHYVQIDRNGPFTGSRKVHNPKPGGYQYNVIHPITKKPCSAPANGYRYPESRMQELLQSERIIFGNDESQIIQIKEYLENFEDKLSSLIVLDSRAGANELGRIFSNRKIFTNPKPHELLKFIFGYLLENNDLLLDFFAGSCASAQAIFELNKEDGGHRKFIMVQLPEPCDEKSEAFKAGYKTIADIGKERIRRVIRKIEEERAAELKKSESMLPGMAESLPDLDLGFRVLKLDRSNFKIWDGNHPDASEEEIARQLELHIDHIDSEASQEDILFELLLKAGFMPTEEVKRRELAGKTVFSIAKGSLLICLENEITRELIDAVVDAEPSQFICLDRGFQGNDQL
ncbi:MAG: site-specific DNA-methyltransferase, partial [Deltaproteobacteria bacterium]|nr:site-specific DNA-methyltransferase [Deltaproteobacteria bacterium]